MPSYVPIQQPVPIKTISFKRLSDGSVQIVCNGFTTDLNNAQDVVGKQVTNTDTRICIKTRNEKLKYIFPVSSLVSVNGIPWTGTNQQNAIDAIMGSVFGGDGTALAKFNQTIAFTAPPAEAHTGAPVTLNGVASSGLPVSYASSNNAVFTIAGNVLTPVGAGTANITASQAGDANYNAAPNVVVAYTLT